MPNAAAVCVHHFVVKMLYHTTMDKMIIPWTSLSEDALLGIIEEFITREGTEYGLVEYGLSEKVEQIRHQIREELVRVVYDAQTNSVSLVVSDDA